MLAVEALTQIGVPVPSIEPSALMPPDIPAASAPAGAVPAATAAAGMPSGKAASLMYRLRGLLQLIS